jgi:hypothetical protein
MDAINLWLVAAIGRWSAFFAIMGGPSKERQWGATIQHVEQRAGETRFTNNWSLCVVWRAGTADANAAAGAAVHVQIISRGDYDLLTV